MQHIHEMARFSEAMRAGLAAGAHMRTAQTLVWDISGRCESPAVRVLTGRSRPADMQPWQTRVRYWQGTRRDIELTVRCGKCPPCLRRRATFWRRRSEAELSQTPGRTWFATLTLRHEEHFKATLGASLRLAAQGVDFDDLSEAEQFRERHRQIGPELTKWLKRVRKNSGASLRYVLVAEPHTGKSGKGSGANLGLPHYHLLIHEGDESSPLRARHMRDAWTLGFSKVILVDQDAERRHAAYVAKYLSKSASARVRASQGYGHANQLPLAIVVQKNDVTTPPDPPTHDATTIMESAVQLILDYHLGRQPEKTVGFLCPTPLTKRAATPPGQRIRARRDSPMSVYKWGTEQ